MQTHQYGAHEVMELHEVMNATIDGINTCQLYMPHTQDPELRQILTNQLQFMTDEYNRLVHLINGRGAGMAIPYRPRTNGFQQTGMTPVNAMMPNANAQQLDDRDISSAVLGIHKSGAKIRMNAALECADWEIRRTLMQGANNCANQAYDIWGYMNRRGYYPLHSMQEIANNHILRGYQPSPSEAVPGGFSIPTAAPAVMGETLYSNNVMPSANAMPSANMMMQTSQPMMQASQPMMQTSQTMMQSYAQPASQPVSNMLGASMPQESNPAVGNASSIFSSPAYLEQAGLEGMMQSDEEDQAEASAMSAQPAARAQRKKPSAT
ncbi:spore coat protein [Brevibacillus migulae]|uniref:spore coat protein n=1 Tax=Brevibacillus migulae TaxID=1644114 RepID=UPI00106E34FD|nr:spore coat protein [Brevibacillus migulae]